MMNESIKKTNTRLKGRINFVHIVARNKTCIIICTRSVEIVYALK